MKFFDRVAVATATTGTGTITLGSVLDTNFFTFAEQGAVDGDVVYYMLNEGGDVEIGIGTLGSSVTELSRDTVLSSRKAGTAGTTKMNLAGAAQVRCIAASQALGPLYPELVRTINSASSSGDRTLTAADLGKLIIFSGTTDFTVTVDPAAALLNGWHVRFKHTGRCVVTIDPNLSETIDGAATLAVAYKQEGTIICTGSAFETFGIQRQVLLETAEFSGVGTVDLLLPPGFKSYDYRINSVFGSAAQNLFMRFSNDGGSSFKAGGSDYEYSGLVTAASTSPGSAGVVFGADSAIFLSFSSPIAAEYTSGSLIIADARASGRQTTVSGVLHSQRPTLSITPLVVGARVEAAEVNDAVRIYPGSGTLTGSVSLYGCA